MIFFIRRARRGKSPIQNKITCLLLIYDFYTFLTKLLELGEQKTKSIRANK